MNNNFFIKLKAFLLLAFALPFSGMGQTKNVISTHRVYPKIDKVQEFEKALSAHAKKFHTGDFSWRVYSIETGPDMGGFQLTEGPTSWEGLDARGDLGEAHTADWNKNIAIYLTDRQSASYAVYDESLSTVAVGDFSDKIQITHVYPKIGMFVKVKSTIQRLKAAWAADGSTVAVYALNASGPSQFAIVTRYKQGLKEKAEGFHKPFKGIYEGIYGDGSYSEFMNEINRYSSDVWSEMLFLRKDLGSK